MAEDLLRAKGDIQPLGKNWVQKFLSRHKEIKTKYIPPLDKERALAQDPQILKDWFELYRRIKAQYNVRDGDIYNMDEKGFLQGVIAKLRVLLSKYEAKKHITQCDNREWTSLIECISLTGRILRPFVIFKAKRQQLSWLDAYPEAHFTYTDNGWTDNKIGLYYFVQCFDPETAIGQEGEYRILLLDGHASHISTKTVEYCVSRKIILLCLPPHTTHLLQPLDVGIFAPLSTAYKNHVHRITRLGAGYAIDKVDFLEILRLARKDAITPTNIQKAWQAVGLSPYNPHLIVQNFLPKATEDEQYHITIPSTGRPDTPPGATVRFGSFEAVLTPGNTQQVRQLLKQALNGQDAKTIVQKVCKSAILAMADSALLERTNSDLLALAQRKEAKKKRRKGLCTGARVMNQEVLDERREAWDWDTAWRRLGDISKDIFGRQKMKKTHAERLAKRATATATATAAPRRRAPAIYAPVLPTTCTPAPPATCAPAIYAPPTPARRAPKTRLPAVRDPETSATPLRKLIVVLPVRVTNGELARRQQRAKE